MHVGVSTEFKFDEFSASSKYLLRINMINALDVPTLRTDIKQYQFMDTFIF